jgi:hypothetical protein
MSRAVARGSSHCTVRNLPTMAETRDNKPNWRNLTFAAIFVVFSLVTGIHAWRNMTVGTASAMGPGFFPLMLSIALGLLALCVGLTARDNPWPLRLAPWKAQALVILAPVVFALSIRTLGLVPAVAATIFMTCFASRFATLREAALLSAGFTTFCVVVFHYLLALPIPLWGTLIAG